MVDGEGAEELARRRKDRRRPAGAKPVRERQVAIVGPQRIVGREREVGRRPLDKRIEALSAAEPNLG